MKKIRMLGGLFICVAAFCALGFGISISFSPSKWGETIGQVRTTLGYSEYVQEASAEYDVDSIAIQSKTARVSVQKDSTVSKLTVDISYNFENEFEFSLDSGKLEIVQNQIPQEKNSWLRYILPSFLVGFNSQIEVRIPTGIEMSSVEIASKNGRVELSGFNALELSVQNNSGKVEMDNVAVNGSASMVLLSGVLEVEGLEASDVTISNRSGSVYLEDIDCSGDFVVDIATGTLRVESATAENISLKNISGTIELSDIAAQTITAQNSSGQIKLEDVIASQNVTLTSTSGSIKLEDVTSAKLSVSISSGSISLDKCAADQMDITSQSGSVKVYLTDSIDNYSLDLKCTSGTVRIDGEKVSREHKTTGGNKTIKIRASSGGISINSDHH